uniref:Uncharacterized protein n=1 Tax=Micrurus corallinus TaxID=54390 RepID=A0A2D4FSC7_MICCO
MHCLGHNSLISVKMSWNLKNEELGFENHAPCQNTNGNLEKKILDKIIFASGETSGFFSPFEIHFSHFCNSGSMNYWETLKGVVLCILPSIKAEVAEQKSLALIDKPDPLKTTT